MREILFRGKRQYNGAWVEGCLYRDLYGNYQIREHKVYDDDVYIDDYIIIPESISEFTGLTDKNGKKVFEGDILSIAQIKDGIGGCISLPSKYPVNVVVKWDMCAWSWETLCKDKRYISFPNAWCHFECEVIGNIHDNPELLKGGEG